MIKTKIEERTQGVQKRFYPMVEKTSLFTRRKYWSTFKQSSPDYESKEDIYYPTLTSAKYFIDTYLLEKGQCEKITHWYPECEEK